MRNYLADKVSSMLFSDKVSSMLYVLQGAEYPPDNTSKIRNFKQKLSNKILSNEIKCQYIYGSGEQEG